MRPYLLFLPHADDARDPKGRKRNGTVAHTFSCICQFNVKS